MAIRDLFDLRDIEDEVKRTSNKQHYKKLKFKEISRKNISLRWKKYRLEKLREKLAEMKFRESEVSRNGMEQTEKKVMKKAKKLAELEAKINFLETGRATKRSFVNSRAINLKKLMMDNLVSNGEYIYSVSKDAADKIKSGEYELTESRTARSDGNTINMKPKSDGVIESDMDETTDPDFIKEVGEAIDAVEKEANANTNAETISRGEVENSIKENLNNNMPLTRTTAEEAIKDNLNTINVGPELTKDALRAAIQEQMEQINLNEHVNSSMPSLGNINEDGTYRLKKEDIDEEIRINYFDRSQLKNQVNDLPAIKDNMVVTNNSEENAGEITPEAPEPTITELADIKTFKPGVIPMPTIVDDEEIGKIQQKRDVPVIAPSRDTETQKRELSQDDNLETQKRDKEVFSGDIETLTARVEILKKEKAMLTEEEKKAAERLTAADLALAKTTAELSLYADSLEADCNQSSAAVQRYDEETAAREEAINAMLAIMGVSASEDTTAEKARTK